MNFLYTKRLILGLFRSDVALLTIATGTSQLLSLALLPYLTSVYSPDQFGIYASILAGITLLSAPLLLRLDAVLQIAPDAENQRVVHAAFVVGGCLTCATTLLGFLFIPFLVDKTTSLNHIILVAVFIPAGAFFTAIYNLGRQCLAKKRKFSFLATSQFLRTATVLIVQCIPAICLLGVFGLTSGFFAGLVLACWILWSGLRAHDIFCPVINANFVTVRSVLKKYRTFITFDVVNIIISAVALTSFPLLILWQFGKYEAGMYSLASRLVFLPLEIFSGAIATVFFQRISEAIRSRVSILPLFYKTLLASVVIALIISFGIVFLGPVLINLFLSEKWQAASEILIWLIPVFLTRFVVGSLASTALALKRPQLQTAWNICQVFVISISLFLAFSGGLRKFLLLSGCGLLACGMGYILLLLFAIYSAERFGESANASPH